MKKYFTLFIPLFFISCASEKQQSFFYLCPEILFSKDHRIYVSSEEQSLTLNNVSYKAEINNYSFIDECIISNNNTKSRLSILFVVKPDKAKNTDIVLPYYIAILDDQKNIVDIQYYKVAGDLKKDIDKSSYIETEIIDTQDINISSSNNILIGFMLDKEKMKILN